MPTRAEAPLGELVVGVGQRRMRRPLDRLEQLAPADAEPAHPRSLIRSTTAAMAALHSASEKKVDVAQPAQNVGLGEADAGLDLGLVARAFGRAGRTPTP